nr:unnamed protein product [Callosobruchus chinensis]
MVSPKDKPENTEDMTRECINSEVKTHASPGTSLTKDTAYDEEVDRNQLEGEAEIQDERDGESISTSSGNICGGEHIQQQGFTENNLSNASDENLPDSDDSINDPKYDSDTESLSSKDANSPGRSIKKSRKRTRNPQNWNTNRQKHKVASGMEHKSKNKIIPAKTIAMPCTDSCRFKCTTNFNEDLRKSIPEFIKQRIREHIMQIPAMESHYSRERSQRKYFGSHLNLSRLYRLYRDYCEEKNIPEQHIAKEWLYTEVFNKEFNISFKYPSNDTCDLCDSYLIRLKDESNAEEKRNLQCEYENHLAEASKRYQLKKTDKEECAKYSASKIMLTVDLQKCLPTPLLTNSQIKCKEITQDKRILSWILGLRIPFLLSQTKVYSPRKDIGQIPKKFDGILYEYNYCMPFGINCAPFVFTKLMKPPLAFLRGKGLPLVLYLDDFLLLGRTLEDCRDSGGTVEQGVQWNNS